jgi:hypothetical protein
MTPRPARDTPRRAATCGRARGAPTPRRRRRGSPPGLAERQCGAELGPRGGGVAFGLGRDDGDQPHGELEAAPPVGDGGFEEWRQQAARHRRAALRDEETRARHLAELPGLSRPGRRLLGSVADEARGALDVPGREVEPHLLVQHRRRQPLDLMRLGLPAPS